jgi:AcrR family transcriptional regulator
VRTRPKDRKDQIVLAAARLFRERGYPAVSIYDIGDAVGTSGAALYRHFDNKEAILVAAYQRASDRVARATEDALRSTDGQSARKQLRAILHADLAWTVKDPDFAAVWLREVRHISVRPTAVLAKQKSRIALYTELLRTLVPTLTLEKARFVVFALSGLTMSVLYYRPEVSPAKLVDALTRAGMGAMLRSAATEPQVPVLMSRTGGGRSRSRREKILWAALALFRERGFAGVSIDEIGDAAGITGPSVYRHFASKEEILGAAFELGDEQILANARDSLETASSPNDALRLLIASYVDRAIENADLIAVYMTEGRWLSPERELAVRRDQRRYVSQWVDVLLQIRPKLSRQDVRALTLAAIGIVNAGVQRPTELSTSEVRETLRAMATGALRQS